MNNIDENKAIEIAKKEAVKLGYSTRYNLAEMKIEAYRYNTPFNKWLPENDASTYADKRREKLKGKNYWAIHFYMPRWRGGAVCIFIDTSTGEMLTGVMEQ